MATRVRDNVHTHARTSCAMRPTYNPRKLIHIRAHSARIFACPTVSRKPETLALHAHHLRWEVFRTDTLGCVCVCACVCMSVLKRFERISMQTQKQSQTGSRNACTHCDRGSTGIWWRQHRTTFAQESELELAIEDFVIMCASVRIHDTGDDTANALRTHSIADMHSKVRTTDRIAVPMRVRFPSAFAHSRARLTPF